MKSLVLYDAYNAALLGKNIFGKIFRFGWSRDLLTAIVDYFFKYFFG
jgi:hypothetical protein